MPRTTASTRSTDRGSSRLVHVLDPTGPDADGVVHPVSGDILIGSAPACDVRIEGLAAYHCQVRRDARGRLVAVALGGELRVDGTAADEAVLRRGARLELGGHVLVLGGEASTSRPQPLRAG